MSKHLRILAGDNLESLRRLAADGVLVDSVVTDPPYGLSFMGKKWDYQVPSVEFWQLVYAVLKPGGHVLSFGGTRTYHRMACALEDAGFEIRDQLLWIHSQGFPKNLDVSKAIDKAAGAKRAVIGERKGTGSRNFCGAPDGKGLGTVVGITAPATPAAREWAGYGTALKPACEPIALARKPLGGKNTVASNVLAFRTGALNIDGCRIGTQDGKNRARVHKAQTSPTGWKTSKYKTEHNDAGRWPANVLLDADAAAVMGEPSRFFYCAKASAKERAGSTHPTVKPVALMRYLCRLITPRGGTILDTFAGSGTTGEAALREGFSVVLMEREAAYVADIRRRLGAGEAAA